MAAKHDQSKVKQASSTANTTNNVTKTLTDSYNQTLNYVTNVSTTSGQGFGITHWLLIGGGSLVLLFSLAILKR